MGEGVIAPPQEPLAVERASVAARSSRAGALDRMLWSVAWDVATRALGVLWTGYLLVALITNLDAFVAAHRQPATLLVVLATAVASRLAFAAFLIVLLVSFVARHEPRAKARGARARAVALLGTFLPTGLVLLPRYDESAVLNLASFALVASGNALAVYALFHLSRSASIMAEARRLVTTGPYRVAQHPLYLSEAIAVVGALLTYLWPPNVAAAALAMFTAHVWCQLRRMRNEERVLAATFPEHAAYASRTARLVPGIY
jgi:protein-S-isoprenylcysteine O-methyltransferase Ste14